MMDKKRVLIVDSHPETTRQINGWLQETCDTICATNCDDALRIASTAPLPDLLLIDSELPGMGGFELCRRLKGDEATRGLPILLITPPANEEGPNQALLAGAADCVTPPINPAILTARVQTHLALKESSERLRNLPESGRELALRTTIRHLTAVQEVTLLAMGSLAETRNSESCHHIRRIAHYVRTLAEQLRKNPRYRHVLTPEYIEMLFACSPLHDIGKAGVPDAILLKPGKLTDDEFEVVKNHTACGRDALLSAKRHLKVSAPFLDLAAVMAFSHHERWDGTGYPEGLAGERIPLPARVMMVADVYDALVTYRIYKPAFSHGIAVEIITAGRGSQFDPDVVDAFLASEKTFQRIALDFSDFELDRIAL